MRIELIDKETASERLEAVKDQAKYFSKSYGKPIAEIKEKYCIDYVNYARLTQLKTGEVCIFADDQPARWLTDFQLDSGQKVIGIMCFADVESASMKGNVLTINFNDHISEYYEYSEEDELFNFTKNSLGTKIRPYRNIFN